MKKYAIATLYVDYRGCYLRFYGEYDPQKMFSDLLQENTLRSNPKYSIDVKKREYNDYEFLGANRVSLNDWLMNYLLAEGWEPYSTVGQEICRQFVFRLEVTN
jgi:hypothetical protein